MAPDNRFIMTEKDREEWKEGLEHADAMKAIRAPVPEPVPVSIETRQQPVLIPYIDVAEAQMEDDEACIACEHVTLPSLVSPDVWNKYLRELGHDGTIDAFLSGEMQEYQANEEYIESMSRMMQAEK